MREFMTDLVLYVGGSAFLLVLIELLDDWFPAY